MQHVARVTCWLLLFAMALVSVVPIELRPVTGLPIDLERFAAFAFCAFAFGVGYPSQRVMVVALLTIAAGGLEILQALQPTRHGELADFLVKASGCLGGGVMSWAVSNPSAHVEELYAAR